ncbi:MAG: ATP-binding protein [Candidatus Helarchaeota archaeon]
MDYFDRTLLSEIKKWIDRREIIAIKGPRQAGKTTLLELLKDWLINEKDIAERNIKYFTFEDREILENFFVAPKDFVKRYVQDDEKYFLLIDEIQYCDDIGQKLKLIYDLFKNVKLVVTGSSSLELTTQTAKFLVGRLFSFELLPLSFQEFLTIKNQGLAVMYHERNESIRNFLHAGENFEIPRTDIYLKDLSGYLDEYLTFGGYPEVVKAKTQEEKIIILKNIVNTYLERDIISYLQITDTIKVRKLVNMLASLIGTLIRYNVLATTCGSYYKEIIRLLDVLQQTYILDLVRPFHKNLVTELRKNPKVYFYDLGIRNYALNNFNSLAVRADTGQLAKNFVFNQLKAINSNTFIHFWRTTAKTEVDFIISNEPRTIPVEVKFRPFKKEKLTRSFYSFINTYQPPVALVVTKNFWGTTSIQNTLVKFIPIVYL